MDLGRGLLFSFERACGHFPGWAVSGRQRRGRWCPVVSVAALSDTPGHSSLLLSLSVAQGTNILNIRLRVF